MKVRFEQVSVRGTRRWKENGKQRQETKVFMQTINPFNLDANGNLKSREQIRQEITAECKAWMAAASNP